jgi:uncharacterized protein (DUF2147 family)
MSIKHAATLAAFMAVATALPAAAATPDGTWLSASGATKVRIAPCGGNYCGTIVWVKGPETKDVKNPDAAKRSRPLVGVQLMYGMTADGDGYKGKLYDYTSGKTYTGKLKAQGGSLSLSGCVLGGLICKSETWTKAN